MKTYQIVQDLQQNLTTLQSAAQCSPWFSLSLKHFKLPHVCCVPQQHAPAAAGSSSQRARPGSGLVQNLSWKLSSPFHNLHKTFGHVSCQTQGLLNALTDQLLARDSEGRVRRSRTHVSSPNIPLHITGCAKPRPFQALPGETNPRVLGVLGTGAGLLMNSRLLWSKTCLGTDAAGTNQAAASEGDQQSDCRRGPCLSRWHQA